MLHDWAISIGKIDSTEYESYGDGEGTYRMSYINLKNGHKYIDIIIGSILKMRFNSMVCDQKK